MTDSKYVLAMYDVRGKQDYIFRGNKIKEIAGGSLVIRDIYKDYLLAKGKGNKIINDTSNVFEWKAFEENMKKRDSNGENLYNGEIVYDGGGNFLVLFRDRETFNKITHKFTYEVLKAAATLRVIGTCVEATHPDDFEKDRRALYEKHRITENTVQNVPLYASVPINLVHSNSALPIVYRGKDYTKEELELTAEQLAKYKKYKECTEKSENDANEFDEEMLDRIAPEKGTDSHIAVIYIDGNSMGAKVEERTKECKTYDECVNALRKFSKEIQKECIDSKKVVIDEKLKELHGDNVKRRIIIGAGDEINMIVAGRDAYEVAKAYLEALDATKGFSSCAGIAVFKSHMPYADAYRIAEECCESGKSLMKKKVFLNTSFLDFHLCQGSIDVSLEQIRRDEETEESSRPWLIVDPCKECANCSDIFKIADIDFIVSFLQKIAHGNTKGLLLASREGASSLRMELRRIKAHQSETDRRTMGNDWNKIDKIADDRLCKIIYDVVLMYDMWFK